MIVKISFVSSPKQERETCTAIYVQKDIVFEVQPPLSSYLIHLDFHLLGVLNP